MKKRLLLNLPVDASTHKYPTMVPYPLLFLKIKEENDLLVDLVLDTWEKDEHEKKRLIDEIILRIIKDEFSDVIVNAGEYAPDGHYKKWYLYFMGKCSKDYKIMGPYTITHAYEINQYKKASIIHTDFDVRNIKIPTEMLQSYPFVGSSPKANVKISWGCPRRCKMCPVVSIYDGKYKFKDEDVSDAVSLIEHYYKEGVRYINFIDDNISVNTKKFKKLLFELKSLNLNGMKYNCQEGFEVISIADKELCVLIKELKFDVVRIGVENIKEDFLETIGKYYTKFEHIDAAVKNIKEVGLYTKLFFLITPFQSMEDILDNIKYFAKNKLDIRANVLRVDYDGTFKHGKEAIVPEKELEKLKSLAYTAAWWGTNEDVNIFNETDFDDYLKSKNTKLISRGNKIYDLEGDIKQSYGFQTSRWLKGMQFMIENKLGGQKIKIDYDDTTKKITKIAERGTSLLTILEGIKYVRTDSKKTHSEKKKTKEKRQAVC